eukprot:scaffold117823_cov39-Prasinocladus_malaysianus.AAC.1
MATDLRDCFWLATGDSCEIVTYWPPPTRWTSNLPCNDHSLAKLHRPIPLCWQHLPALRAASTATFARHSSAYVHLLTWQFVPSAKVHAG